MAGGINVLALLIFFIIFLEASEAGEKDEESCNSPLGLENGKINDSALTASSSYDPTKVGPANARLHDEKHGGAWCPKDPISPEKDDEYLQIDLGDTHVINEVLTQGRFANGQGQEYARAYRLQYWRKGMEGFKEYRDSLGRTILPGNKNTYAVANNSLNPPILAAKLRILPHSNHSRTVCLRVGLRGCQFTDPTTTTKPATTTTTSTTANAITSTGPGNVDHEPEFEVTEEFIEARTGDSIELVCNVQAVPKPTVVWHKNGDIINTDANIEIMSIGHKHTLSIEKVGKEDYGTYYCEAKNIMGAGRKKFEIAERLSGYPTWIQQNVNSAEEPQHVLGTEGQSVYLTCKVAYGQQNTITWIRHKDFHILALGRVMYTADPRFQSIYDPATDEWILQINQLHKRDQGVYECEESTEGLRKSFFVGLKVLDNIPKEKLVDGQSIKTKIYKGKKGDCFDKNLDYFGHDINIPTGANEDRRDSAAECQDLCSQRTECNFFTWKSLPYHSGECWLKTSGGPSLASYQLGSISGPRQCVVRILPLQYTADMYEDAVVGSIVLQVKADNEATYSIKDGNFKQTFKIDEQTGFIRVNKPLDYERIKEYALIVEAWDGQFSSDTLVQINIHNRNDMKPRFANNNYQINLKEEIVPSYPVLQVTATDPDIEDPNAEQNITYSLDQTNTISDHFKINPETGVLTLVKPLDRDLPDGFPRWSMFVFARDEYGAASGLENFAEVTIDLEDVNDNAPYLNMPDGLVWYENSEPGLVEKLEAQDFDEEKNGAPFTFEIDPKAVDIKSKFSIVKKNSNGEYWLKTKTTFDGEAQRQYKIPVKISDNQGLGDVSTLLLVIGDKNDNPIHPDKTRGAEEGSPHITEHPNSTIVPKNEPLTLSCKAQGIPKPEIVWFKDGKEVSTAPKNPKSHKLILPTGDLFFIKTIQTKSDQDDGVYWCEARNQVGKARSRNATVQVASINKTALFGRSDDFVVGNIERFWEFAPSWGAPNFVPSTSIYFSILYHTTGNGTQCCQECKDIYDPTTSFVNFYEFTSNRETNQYCSCSNYISGDPKTFPTPERIRGFQGQYLTELCDNWSIDVAGGVGEDKHFVADSVDYLGWAPFSMDWTDPLVHARDAAGSCCQACKNWDSSTRNRRMVEYDRGGQGRCKCIDVKPGKTPTTQNVKWFADTC